MARPTLEERRKRRHATSLVERATAGWFLDCPTHGKRVPVHPYAVEPRCFHCHEDGRA